MTFKQFKDAGYTLTETIQRTAIFNIELDGLIEDNKNIDDVDASDLIGGDLISEFDDDTESIYDITDDDGVVVLPDANIDAVKAFIKNL